MAAPSARSLIVDLTPPALLRLAQRSRRHMRHLARDIGFRTILPGRDASRADIACGEGYDDDQYAELIVTNKLRAMKAEPYDIGSAYLILAVVGPPR
jgi:hypothetical protein